jgi:hypothetical protein
METFENWVFIILPWNFIAKIIGPYLRFIREHCADDKLYVSVPNHAGTLFPMGRV